MPSSELERVAADLTSIRDAMGLGTPYTRDDMTRDLVTALCGLLAIVLILFSPLDNKLAFMLGLLPGLLYYLRFTAQQHSRRAANPIPWREEKLTLKALAIAVPLVVVWLLWSRLGGPSENASLAFSNTEIGSNLIVHDSKGIGTLQIIDSQESDSALAGDSFEGKPSSSLAAAAALYFMGVGLGVLGLIDPNRRRYLAASVVLIAYGMASPSLTPQQMILGAAVALVAGGVLSAAITFFQLRSGGDYNQGELA